MFGNGRNSGSVEVEFSVPTMVCDGCAERMRNVLGRLPGVRQVRPKLWSKRVIVRYAPGATTEDQLRAALEEAGFPPNVPR